MGDPYILISFVEEAVMNPKYEGFIAGRIEVYRKRPYADEEIRFFTKNQRFARFRRKWDMKKVYEWQVREIRGITKVFFNHD
jgi:hypothetical protein